MSDDLPVAPDPVVRTALQLLPVPPHGEGFWSELDRMLGASNAPRTGEAEEQPDPLAIVRPLTPAIPFVDLDDDSSMRLVPPALRRRSNAVAAVAAAAAVVVVVVAGAALLRERSGTAVDTSEVAAPSSEPAALSTTSSSPEQSTKPNPSSEVPSAAVFSWIAALEQGDGDAAWDAMGPAAKSYLSSRAELESMMGGLAEGYGAWAAATPDIVLITPLGDDDQGATVVVTLIGEVEQEGVLQQRADAFVVRVLGDGTELEPFDTAGTIEVVLPDIMAGQGQTVADDELVIVVPAGADAPVVRLDDGDPVVCGDAPGTELTELETADGRRCAYTPQDGVTPGRRVLTVAFSTGGGEHMSAETFVFEAA